MLVTLFLTSLVILPATLTANSQPIWNTQIVDKNATTDREAIALDSNNNPHVAYSDYEYGDYSEPSDIMYASLSGQNWTIQTVDGNADNGGPLAVGSDGHVHIIYTIENPQYPSYVFYVKYATALEPTITSTEKPNIFSATGALILPLTISIITVVVAVLALVLFVLFRRHRKTPKV